MPSTPPSVSSPAGRRDAKRIVIAGASSLLGAEVRALLEESRFAGANIRLLDEPFAAGLLTRIIEISGHDPDRDFLVKLEGIGFGFLIPIPFIGGIGKRTAIVALVLYALLPILRNTLAGILGVDAAVRESAIAMGMTGRQLLWEVELPLAAPTILAGVRIATVTTIGTATIAAAIGGGGGLA